MRLTLFTQVSSWDFGNYAKILTCSLCLSSDYTVSSSLCFTVISFNSTLKVSIFSVWRIRRFVLVRLPARNYVINGGEFVCRVPEQLNENELKFGS